MRRETDEESPTGCASSFVSWLLSSPSEPVRPAGIGLGSDVGDSDEQQPQCCLRQVQDDLDRGEGIIFEWGQKDFKGRQVDPGRYQIELKRKDGTSIATFEIEGDVSQPLEGAARSGEIGLKPRHQTFSPGRTVSFILENGTSQILPLNDVRFIIEARQPASGEWREFFTSDPNFLSVRTLAPGQKAFWNWDRWDNERQHKVSRGNFRISLTMPQVREAAYIARFRLKGE